MPKGESITLCIYVNGRNHIGNNINFSKLKEAEQFLGKHQVKLHAPKSNSVWWFFDMRLVEAFSCEINCFRLI